MNLQQLLGIQLQDLSWNHVLALVSNSFEESFQFEIKRGLSANQGQVDSWMSGSNKIGRVAKDDLAKEVVAFANDQGGMIVIGIDETDEKPSRAKSLAETLIPKCHECAEHLGDALSSMIDPKLNGL